MTGRCLLNIKPSSETSKVSKSLQSLFLSSPLLSSPLPSLSVCFSLSLPLSLCLFLSSPLSLCFSLSLSVSLSLPLSLCPFISLSLFLYPCSLCSSTFSPFVSRLSPSPPVTLLSAFCLPGLVTNYEQLCLFSSAAKHLVMSSP